MRNITLIFAALAATACADTATEPQRSAGALISIAFSSHPADTLLVYATDSAAIDQAEAFVRTGNGPKLIVGRIVKGSGSDPRYPFHFIPGSIEFADVAMEICDGAPMKTESEVAQFFEWATGSADSESAPWCPWSSKPVSVQRVTY